MSIATVLIIIIAAYAFYASVQMRSQQRTLNESIKRIATMESLLCVQRVYSVERTSVSKSWAIGGEMPSQFASSTAATESDDSQFIEDHFNEFGLTNREKEVLWCILLGKDSVEIGERLFVSISTVKSHTYNIYRKLGVHSRREAVELFEQQGLACRLEEV